jgi:hypothetical protein
MPTAREQSASWFRILFGSDDGLGFYIANALKLIKNIRLYELSGRTVITRLHQDKFMIDNQ